jgi:hypothetical protein
VYAALRPAVPEGILVIVVFAHQTRLYYTYLHQLVYQALSATSVSGLKLLVHEAVSSVFTTRTYTN